MSRRALVVAVLGVLCAGLCLAADFGKGIGVFAAVDGDPHDVGTGGRQIVHLGRGRRDVLCMGRAHALDGNRASGADRHRADFYAPRWISGQVHGNSILPPIDTCWLRQSVEFIAGAGAGVQSDSASGELAIQRESTGSVSVADRIRNGVRRGAGFIGVLHGRLRPPDFPVALACHVGACQYCPQTVKT